MKFAAVAPKALPGAFALFWAVAAWATLGGTAGKPAPTGDLTPTSAVLPSIEILSKQTNLAGTCGGAPFSLNTYIKVDSLASADVHLAAHGIPTLEQFTDETGTNLGPSFTGIYPNFNIIGFGGGLAPNTSIVLSITTYSGHALSGNVTYVSSMQFDCTTGLILNLTSGAPGDPPPVPALSDAALGMTAALVLLVALLALRRRPLTVRQPRSQHPLRRP